MQVWVGRWLRWWGGVALASAALFACRHQPGARGSDFVRVSTAHFTIYADLRASQAEEHARKLEHMLYGLLETGWDYHGRLPFKLNVVLLSSRNDLQELVPAAYGGYFLNDLMGERWTILGAPRRSADLRGLLHELSHHLAYLVLPYQPVWFAEGLAGYYETARLENDGLFVLGSPDHDHHRFLSRNGIMPAAKLFAFQESATPRVYASSWLTVHYLMNRHPDAFVRYQDGLANGQMHASAWRSAFPELSDEQLDEEIVDYFAVGEYPVLEAPIELRDVPLTTTPLSMADEDALRASLWLSCWRCTPKQRGERAWRHVERALRLDPTQVEARLMSATLRSDDEESVRELRALTKDVPHDYRGWIALAERSRGEEAREALQQALALAPQQAHCWQVAAEQARQRGELDQALASAQRGLRLRPTSLDLLLLNAEILAQLRHCPELRRVVARAEGLDERFSRDAQRQRARELAASCDAR